MTYSNNPKLEDMIQAAVVSIEAGAPNTSLTAMIKNSRTYIILASPNHTETRYQPGHQLVTYNGIDQDGKPIQETWGGGVAEIKENSVILRNAEPIKYPEGHQFQGQAVQGFYRENGQFIVVPADKIEEVEKHLTVGRLDTLFNEYVSDVEFVKGAYGVQATEQLQTGLKLQPSYVLQIPSDLGQVAITTKSGVEINLSGGDYVLIDAKKAKVTSVHGCESKWLDKTYVTLESHLSTLKQ